VCVCVSEFHLMMRAQFSESEKFRATKLPHFLWPLLHWLNEKTSVLMGSCVSIFRLKEGVPGLRGLILLDQGKSSSF